MNFFKSSEAFKASGNLFVAVGIRDYVRVEYSGERERENRTNKKLPEWFSSTLL